MNIHHLLCLTVVMIGRVSTSNCLQAQGRKAAKFFGEGAKLCEIEVFIQFYINTYKHKKLKVIYNT